MMTTIIAVDDTPTNLLLYRHLFQEMPEWEVRTFQEPQAALAYLRQPPTEAPADLVLLDYMMPEIDGLALFGALRDLPHRCDIPVVIVTAAEEREVRYAALKAGVNDFLLKPVDRVELLTRVRNLLALYEAKRQLADRAAWLAEEVKKATATLREREREIIWRLSRAAEYRDPETGAHIMRMARYSELIARTLGLPEAECETVLLASPMHDVGKVGIPDHILMKPGRLSDEEFAIMKRHAEYGYEILKGSSSPLLQTAALIAWTHHERWDGNGYPRGLRGEEIPLYGRIVAVADVFDAVTSNRPYKPAWPLERAVGLLQEERGRHFDPACVEAFLSQLNKALEIQEQYRDNPFEST
ncbi:MAG: response regulator [Hydrogenophilus sp.]|nr:response regulator [Hydrogenophilus sp.]